MPRPPSFLDRFRRLFAPPGRPREALGVPASPEDMRGELTPLFAQLDAVGVQAQKLERDANAHAEQLRADARAHASEILQRARQHAEVERVRAAREQRTALEQRTTELREASRLEVQRIASAQQDRVGKLVTEVLECVRRGGR